MSVRYGRLPQSENNDNKKNSFNSSKEKITEKIHAGFWVVISILILYYTDLIHQITSDKRIERFSLTIAITSLSINLVLVLYSTIWLPYMMKTKVPIEIYAPKLVPISALLAIITIIMFMYALWPIYGLLTPLLILILTLGLLLSCHFIPWIF